MAITSAELITVRPQGSRVRTTPLAVLIPLVSLIVCNLADVATTNRILAMGGREMNPVAGWLIANDGLIVAKLGMVAVIAAAALLTPPRRWIVQGMWIAATFYAAIIAFHVVQLTLA